jgi:hypothetical protein
MSVDSNMESILHELSKRDLDANQVANILNNPDSFPTELIEKISLETAIKFWGGKISYDDGNHIMNRIYDFWLWNEYFFKNFTFPSIAQKCYDAFDSGEYRHDGDEPSISPVEKYTKSRIENLLRCQNLII